MNDGLIPRRYALALYKYAKEKNVTAIVYEEMKQVAESFRKLPDLQKVMSNPFVSRQDKGKLLMQAAGDKLEDAYKSFVKLILDANREQFAYQMALAYRDIYRKENRIAQVIITSAVALDKEQEQKIKDIVHKSYKDMTLEFSFNTNPDIIGGFVITVDSNRLDASVSNELQQIRKKLLRSN
ncbi:MAG: F0F1 ATP synthase subunit delta [Prevotella sp.]|nr:F0F1 ATP synthase subunit delta [Bacteroides sp.]MCM1365941.1 F0F1 ATP synthase subunit delta [Prevotella sp.]MCM1436638.1 F0F1 ATP synthase subunit delta [Prevotella sp.]